MFSATTRFILVAAAGLAATACMSTNPGKTRSEDPITIGNGVHYRPTSSFGIGVHALGDGGKDQQVGTRNKDYENGEDLLAKKTRSKTNDTSFYGLWYPSEKSFFCVGLGGVVGYNQLTFDEKPVSGDETVEVDVKDSYVAVGPVVGWTWMWDWGLTIHFDPAPKFYVSRTRTFAKGGDGSGVDETARDETIHNAVTLDPLQRGTTYVTVPLMFGFSF